MLSNVTIEREAAKPFQSPSNIWLFDVDRVAGFPL